MARSAREGALADYDAALRINPRYAECALALAAPVYALLGERSVSPDEMPPLDRPLVAGRRAYHVRSGVHDLTLFDWERYLDFADSLWKKG